MYKLNPDFDGIASNSVSKIELPSVLSIPFDPANTDYQQFKTDVLGGAELQDADGNVMTQAEVQSFLETLP